jgi:hypothetical protein
VDPADGHAWSSPTCTVRGRVRYPAVPFQGVGHRLGFVPVRTVGGLLRHVAARASRSMCGAACTVARFGSSPCISCGRCGTCGASFPYFCWPVRTRFNPKNPTVSSVDWMRSGSPPCTGRGRPRYTAVPSQGGLPVFSCTSRFRLRRQPRGRLHQDRECLPNCGGHTRPCFEQSLQLRID